MKINTQGFTLIEVLIALVILAIALTAIIKSTSQNIRDTTYLQNKTIATWVGTYIVNKARAGLLQLPAQPSSLKQETEMLNRQWSWQASMNPTANPRIKTIEVSVFLPANHAKLTTLVSYVYISQ